MERHHTAHRQQLVLIVFSWLVAGIVAVAANFLKIMNLPWAYVLVIPISVQFVVSVVALKRISSFTKIEKILTYTLLLILLLHFIGVLVPEHGFDAVWYHLPIIRSVVEQHGFISLPDLYQSVNPQFADALFVLGYLILGETGAKMVAYLLMIALIQVTILFCSMYLERKWVLLLACTVALFQVVTWQASSIYVDVAKAFWECSALYMVFLLAQQRDIDTKERYYLSVVYGLASGASLATKLFSLILAPLFLYIYWRIVPRYKMVLLVLLCMLLVSLPFYVFSWTATGMPFASFTIHSGNIQELTGFSSWIEYGLSRTFSFIQAPFVASFFIKDYTSPLFALSCIYLLFVGWKKNCPTIWRGVIVYCFVQLLIWWYLPPLSTRYALSGFILTMVFSCIHFVQSCKVQLVQRWVFIVACISVVALILPRMYVASRDLKYLVGQQSKKVYLEQFYDGNIDIHIQNWHKIK